MFADERETYLAYVTVERGLSPHTIAAYRRDISRYESFLVARGHRGLATTTRADVAAFSEAIVTGADGGRPLAPASASRTVVAIRGWHKFAVAEGWTAEDPSSEVKPRALPQRLPKAISPDAVARILAQAGSGDGIAALRDRALLEVLYATGARVSEATGLAVDDVSLEPGEQAVLLRGKGRKERVVPVGQYAADALSAYLVRARPAFAAAGTGTSALFLNSRGAQLSRQSAWAILKVAAQSAGVDDVSPHTLRHSFATHLMSGGADVRVVQELLGHASVTTTQIYTAVTQDALREVYEASHPRAR